MSKYFAIFNEAGIFVTTMIEGIHEIPDGAVEISREKQLDIIDDPSSEWFIGDDGVIGKRPFPPPTGEQIIERNTSIRDKLKIEASQAMAPVLVSLQLGDATDDETVIAKQWQEYYRGLTQVDLSVPEPEWPVKP